MKCLSKKMCFHYISKELSQEEMTAVLRHISECRACSRNMEMVRNRIIHVREALENLNPSHVPEAAFIGPDKKMNERDHRDHGRIPLGFNPFQYIIDHPGVAAGFAVIIICLTLAITNTNWLSCEQENIVPVWMDYNDLIGLDAETDWNEKRLIITIIDESAQKAEIIETSIHKENVTRRVVGIDRIFTFVKNE